MCRPRHRHSIGKAPRLYGEPQSRASKVAQSSLSSCWKMLINVRPKSFRPRLGTPKEALRASSQGLRRHVLHLLRDLPHEVAAMLPASFPTFLSLGLAMSKPQEGADVRPVGAGVLPHKVSRLFYSACIFLATQRLFFVRPRRRPAPRSASRRSAGCYLDRSHGRRPHGSRRTRPTSPPGPPNLARPLKSLLPLLFPLLFQASGPEARQVQLLSLGRRAG